MELESIITPRLPFESLVQSGSLIMNLAEGPIKYIPIAFVLNEFA